MTFVALQVGTRLGYQPTLFQKHFVFGTVLYGNLHRHWLPSMTKGELVTIGVVVGLLLLYFGLWVFIARR